MQATNGRLVLCPSDLNDYVECPHLTTLSLEVARGTRRRPHMPEDHADLLRRKGEEHEAAYLKELRAQGRQVTEVIGADPWDFDISARLTEEAMRGAQAWCVCGPLWEEATESGKKAFCGEVIAGKDQAGAQACPRDSGRSARE